MHSHTETVWSFQITNLIMSRSMLNMLKCLPIAFRIQNSIQNPSIAFHGPVWYFCSYLKHFTACPLCSYYPSLFFFFLVLLMCILLLFISHLFYIMSLSLKYFLPYIHSLACVQMTRTPFTLTNLTHAAGFSLKLTSSGKPTLTLWLGQVPVL